MRRAQIPCYLPVQCSQCSVQGGGCSGARCWDKGVSYRYRDTEDQLRLGDQQQTNIQLSKSRIYIIIISLLRREGAAVREDIKLPTPSNISSVQFRYTHVRCGSEVTVIVELVSESEI